MKDRRYYKRDNTGKTHITAFQIFQKNEKIVRIDKLITPMLLTEELMSTQFYDK